MEGLLRAGRVWRLWEGKHVRDHRRVLIFFVVLVVGISLGATGSAQEVRASPSHTGFLLAAGSGHLIATK